MAPDSTEQHTKSRQPFSCSCCLPGMAWHSQGVQLLIVLLHPGDGTAQQEQTALSQALSPGCPYLPRSRSVRMSRARVSRRQQWRLLMVAVVTVVVVYGA